MKLSAADFGSGYREHFDQRNFGDEMLVGRRLEKCLYVVAAVFFVVILSEGTGVPEVNRHLAFVSLLANVVHQATFDF